MNPKSQKRREPAHVSTPRRVAWQFVVWVGALLLLGMCATIALAGSREPPPDWEHDRYAHGWPWQFGHRLIRNDVRDRFQFWQELVLEDQRALVADIFVLLAASVVIIASAWRISRRAATFSLRGVAIAVTSLCFVCGYVAAHRRAALAERDATATFDGTPVHVNREYVGPRWLLRLAGDSAVFRGSFDRVTTVGFIVVPPVEFDGDFGRSLSELHYLRTLWCNPNWTDEDVLNLLQARETWPIEEVHFFLCAEITADALAEMERCPHLIKINITNTQVDDRGIEYLLRCHHLEVVYASSSRITARSRVHFSKMKRLKYLAIDNSGFSDSEIDQFRKLRLEKLRIDQEIYEFGALVNEPD